MMPMPSFSLIAFFDREAARTRVELVRRPLGPDFRVRDGSREHSSIMRWRLPASRNIEQLVVDGDCGADAEMKRPWLM